MTRNLAREARALWHSGTPANVLAKKYSVGKSTMQHLLAGRTWRDA